MDARIWWELLLCVINKWAWGTPVQVWHPLVGQPASQPASQPAEFFTPWTPRVLLLLKGLLFFLLLGPERPCWRVFSVLSLKQVWIKAAASPSPTRPDLYCSSEVFEKKENLKIVTSSISSLLPMLCFSHRTCFLPSSPWAIGLDRHKILRDQSQQTLVVLLSNSTWKCKLQCIYKLA